MAKHSASLSMTELLENVAKGNLFLIRKSLVNGFPPNDREITDIRLLQTALKTNNREIAKLLIEAGCSVNDHRYSYYTSPLYLAVSQGDIEIVQMLLNRNADLDVKSSGETCLHVAAQGKYKILQILLRHRCNINLCNRSGNTVLQVLLDYCAKNENDSDLDVLKEKLVLKLLQKGAKIYSVDEKGQSPIHVAATMKNKSLLSIILKYCTNVNVLDNNNDTPLCCLLKSSSDQDVTEEKRTLKLFQNMLQRGGQLKTVNKDGDTLLHLAATNKLFSIMKVILNSSLDINSCDTNGKNVLHRLLENNIEEHEAEKFNEVVEILISKGIFINKRDGNGETPLHLTCKYSNKYGVEVLLRHNVNVTVVDKQGNTVLHSLRINDINKDIGKVHELLKRCSINVRNKLGEMPIHIAAKEKRINDIKIFLQYHGDVNTCDDNDNSIMYNLLKGIPAGKESIKYIEIIYLLLSKNVLLKPCLNLIATCVPREIFCFLINDGRILNIRDNKLNTLLHILIEKNEEPDILKPLNLVLGSGADVNSQNINGKTALHLAVEKEQVNTIKALLQYKADVTICTNQGNSALHLLSLKSNHDKIAINDIIGLLVKHGCDINYKNSNKQTPLLIALEKGSLVMTETLLQYNTNISLIRSDLSMLHLAVKNNNYQMLKILLKVSSKYNINIDAKWQSGQSALHIAIHQCKSDMVQMLLDYDADIELQDSYGKTALHWACWWENPQIVRNLLMHGADVNALDKTGVNPVHLISKTLTETGMDVVRHMIIHIGKLIAAGLFVTDANKQFYKTYDKTGLLINIEAECQSELEEMKNSKIDSNKTLFEIIRMKQNTCYISENHNTFLEILNADFLDNVLKIYCYSNMIKSYYKRAVRRNILVQRAIDSFKQSTKFSIPYECHREIFKYLKNEHLRNIIEAVDLNV